jgi:hypothetical protein
MRQIRSPRLWLRVLAGGGLAVVMSATAADAQRTVPPDLTSRKIRIRDIGADPNVTPPPEVNVRDKPPGAAPPAGRGSANPPQCLVTVDNATDLISKAYIDGRYSGTVRPHASLAVSNPPGSAVLYARAEYEDGSADAWGPVRVSCRTKYVWRLAD